MSERRTLTARSSYYIDIKVLLKFPHKNQETALGKTLFGPLWAQDSII